jgi:hypothetical protein
MLTCIGGVDTRGMSARDVEQLGRRLRDLNERAAGELALAGVAFVLALLATELRPDLVVPLLAGAVGLTALGIVAFVRSHLLVEDAAADRDAYLLPAVRRFGERAASPGHRRELAAWIRRAVAVSPELASRRVDENRAALEELRDDLERPDLPLEPACAVALDRLLQDGGLYDGDLPAEELRSRLTQILAGFGGGRVPE